MLTMTPDLVLTLDRVINNCTLIDYDVNSSSTCGVCDIGLAENENVVTCVNTQIDAECTVYIGTKLCEFLVDESVYTINVTSPSTSLLTTVPTTASVTSSNQPGTRKYSYYICI